MLRSLIIMLLLSAPLAAQTIDEWRSVHTGHYSGSQAFNVLHTSSAPYLAAVSSTSGFDSSNVVQLSDDGGHTWRNALYAPSFPFNPFTGTTLDVWWREQHFQSIVRPSRDTVMVYAGRRPKDDPNTSSAYGTMLSTILRTTDGGTTWHEVEIVPGRPLAFFRNAMAMDHRSIGYALSADTTDTTMARLYRTTDAGATWSAMEHEPLGAFIVGPYALGDSVVALMANDRLFLSTDGGTTFTYSDLPPRVHSLTFRTSSDIVAAGGTPTGYGSQQRAQIYRSTDAGGTWTTVIDSVMPEGDVMDVDINANGDILILFRSATLLCKAGQTAWTSIAVPYGTNGFVAVRCRWVDGETAVAQTGTSIILRTGRQVPIPPTMEVVRGSDTTYAYRWETRDGDLAYRFQIAKRITAGLPSYDYTIFDTPEALELDTVLTDNEVVRMHPRGHDIYVRVRRFTAADTSDWSEQRLVRIPGTPDVAALSSPVMVHPPQMGDVTGATVSFVWYGDPRTETWDLVVTDVDPGTTGTWDISKGYSRYGLTDTATTISLPTGHVYYWYVGAHAPSMSSSKTAGYRQFTLSPGTSVDEGIPGYADNDVHGTSILTVMDVLGRCVETRALDRLPAGMWLVVERQANGTITTRKVIGR